jgi:hypothetical protein
MAFKFYYDTDDNTLELIDTNGNTLVQGQSNSVEFRFYFKNYDTNVTLSLIQMFEKSCLVNIERPDGSSSNNVLTTPVIDDGDFYYKLLIGGFVTDISGTLKITAKLFENASDVTTTFGLATLNISPSASVSQSTIEDFQYQAILASFNDFINDLPINKIDCVAFFPIAKGRLVMVSGIENQKLRVSEAGNLQDEGVLVSIHKNPEIILGIALNDANSGGNVVVLTQGVITDINTSMYQQGKTLVPHATINGRLIEIDNVNNFDFTPVAPKNRMPIAISIYSHETNGILFVRPTFFPLMSQVQDVDMNGIKNTNVLTWNGQKFIPKFMNGVYYNNDVPAVEDRFVNLTYFDEAETND